MWYVHFLELSNGDIYVGSTHDLSFASNPISTATWIQRARIGL
jgi:hypothetical protein